MARVPYDWVKKGMVDGTAEPSLVSKALEAGELDQEEDYNLKWASNTFYIGAADTVRRFFLLLSLLAYGMWHGCRPPPL